MTPAMDTRPRCDCDRFPNLHDSRGVCSNWETRRHPYAIDGVCPSWHYANADGTRKRNAD
jgi:hypothetical protein